MERQYKDSGIEWIGRIPKDWEVLPHKHLMRKRKELCPKYDGEDIISLTTNGVIVRDLTAGGKMPTTFDGYQFVYPGNLLMCLFDIDVTPRCVGYVKNEGLTSPAYSRFEMADGAYGPYYDYLLRYMDDEKCLLHLSKNLRSSLTEEDFGQILSVLPSYIEQQRIADYLDKKCGEIDTLIVLQEQMIENLKAYKQSVITEAVTKGLNPNAKLVPSGIDWIGEIPEDWNVCRIKDISTINNNSLTENTQSDYEFDYVDIGSVSFEQGIYKSEHYMFKDAPSRARKKANLGDIVMSTVRTYLRAIDVVDTLEKSQFIYSTGFAIITPSPNVLSSFLSFITKSDSFLKQVIVYSKGINYPSINSNELMAISVTLPPISEQNIIAEYLSKKCKEIDNLVSIKQQKIEKLKDYKKSVIYEAVTGKIIIES